MAWSLELEVGSLSRKKLVDGNDSADGSIDDIAIIDCSLLPSLFDNSPLTTITT
jgi:hypothetical protein